MFPYLPFLVEFLGTFVFLFVIIATGNPWMIGATLAVIATIGGAISGGHFNPAVTIMFLYHHGITATSALIYIVVQICAGILAIVTHNKLVENGVL